LARCDIIFKFLVISIVKISEKLHPKLASEPDGRAIGLNHICTFILEKEVNGVTQGC